MSVNSEKTENNASEEKKYKYDAFISYRHAELDIYAAEQLHKMLESFKIPRLADKAFAKDQKHKITRVFRDKDELPVSDNLSDPITAALADSEFLIVICSPRTPESMWVKKEIEIFTELHGRDHILALLIEGEPNDSFPQVLCHTTKKTVDKDGNEVEEDVLVEPLAADIRSKFKVQMHSRLKKEILRLAAPIIGCGYDDLRQRHKEQRLKRNICIATAVAAICFAVGSISTWQALRINRQSHEISGLQSKSQASRAKELYERGDRMTAALLARDCIPGQSPNSLTLTSEAQWALSDVLRVYDNGESYLPDFKLTANATLRSVTVNDSCTYAAAVDEIDNLYIWDLQTQELLSCEHCPAGTVAEGNLQFIDDTHFVVGGSEGLCFLNTDANVQTIVSDFYVSEIALSSKKSFCAASDGYSVRTYSTASTEETCRFEPGDQDYGILFGLSISDNGKYMTFGKYYNDDGTNAEVALCDVKMHKELCSFKLPYNFVTEATVDNSGNVFAVGKDTLVTGSFKKTSQEALVQFDKNGKVISNYKDYMMISSLPYQENTKNNIMLIPSNTDLLLFSTEKKSMVNKLSFTSPVEFAKMSDTTPAVIRCCLQDGSVWDTECMMETTGLTTQEPTEAARTESASPICMTDTIIAAKSDDSTSLYIYSKQKNKQATELCTYSAFDTSRLLYSDSEDAFAAYSIADSMPVFCKLSDAQNAVKLDIPEGSYIYDIYSAPKASSFVIVTFEGVYEFSWTDGALLNSKEYEEVMCSSFDQKTQKLYIQWFDTDGISIDILSVPNLKEQKNKILTQMPMTTLFATKKGSHLIGIDALNTAYDITVKTGDIQILPWTSSQLAQNPVNKNYIVADLASDMLSLYNEKNTFLTGVSLPVTQLSTCGFSDDGSVLYVQYLDKSVEIRSAKSLDVIQTLTDIDSVIGKIESHSKDGLYIIYSGYYYGGTGYLCSKDFKILASVPKLYALTANKQLLSTNSGTVLSTPMLSLEELLNEASAQLGDRELTTEEKLRNYVQ